MSTTSSIRSLGYRDESVALATNYRTNSKTKVDFFYRDRNKLDN